MRGKFRTRMYCPDVRSCTYWLLRTIYKLQNKVHTSRNLKGITRLPRINLVLLPQNYCNCIVIFSIIRTYIIWVRFTKLLTIFREIQQNYSTRMKRRTLVKNHISKICIHFTCIVLTIKALILGNTSRLGQKIDHFCKYLALQRTLHKSWSKKTVAMRC